MRMPINAYKKMMDRYASFFEQKENEYISQTLKKFERETNFEFLDVL